MNLFINYSQTTTFGCPGMQQQPPGYAPQQQCAYPAQQQAPMYPATQQYAYPVQQQAPMYPAQQAFMPTQQALMPQQYAFPGAQQSFSFPPQQPTWGIPQQQTQAPFAQNDLMMFIFSKLIEKLLNENSSSETTTTTADTNTTTSTTTADTTSTTTSEDTTADTTVTTNTTDTTTTETPTANTTDDVKRLGTITYGTKNEDGTVKSSNNLLKDFMQPMDKDGDHAFTIAEMSGTDILHFDATGDGKMDHYELLAYLKYSDTNNDGQVTQEEREAASQRINANPNTENQKIIDSYNAMDKGPLGGYNMKTNNLGHGKLVMAREYESEDAFIAALDIDRDGTIETDELEKAGQSFTEQGITHINIGGSVRSIKIANHGSVVNTEMKGYSDPADIIIATNSGSVVNNSNSATTIFAGNCASVIGGDNVDNIYAIDSGTVLGDNDRNHVKPGNINSRDNIMAINCDNVDPSVMVSSIENYATPEEGRAFWWQGIGFLGDGNPYRSEAYLDRYYGEVAAQTT